MRLFAEVAPAPAAASPVSFTIDRKDVAEDAALEGLPQRIRALFYDPAYSPPSPPSVALELVALARHGELDIAEAVSLFQRDPLLMARVLRVARSPLYGAAKVPTIRDAVVRLGERKLVHVVLEAALEMKVFKSDVFGPWMERVRRHSVAVGHIAAHIAGVVGSDPDQALVAGLMHDIGTAAALGAIGNDAFLKKIDPATIARALTRIHTDIGAVVADAWDLNTEVEAVVSGHHHVQKTHDPVLATVVLAEAFAHDGGFVADGDDVVEDDVTWARECLNVSDERMTRIGRELAPLFAVL